MDAKEKAMRLEELQRLVRTAALTVDATGNLKTLCKTADIKYHTLCQSLRRGYFTVGTASALELAFGPELLPREKLCLTKQNNKTV